MTCKSWHPWYTFEGPEQGYWCCFAGRINQKFSSVFDVGCEPPVTWAGTKTLRFLRGVFLPFKCPYLPMRIPIPCTTCDVIGLNGHRLFWHLQLEQEKEIFHEHESGKQAREKNVKWTSKIDQKIDYLPIHVPCTFYWKIINSQPLQFLLKLFPLSGCLK